MPLCGFSQKMLEGLTAFHEGLVEHGIMDRSRTKKQSFNQTLEGEISDMDRFLRETHRISDQEVRETLEALTKYAQAFYSLIRRNGVQNYRQTVQRLNGFYAEMDDKFYRDLEGNSDDMVQLAEHLSEFQV